MWRQTLSMSADPHPEVARNAGIIVDYIICALLESPLGPDANEVLDEIIRKDAKRNEQAHANTMDGLNRQRSRDQRPMTPPSPTASTASKQDGYFSGLSRTASVAAAMKNFVGWGARAPSGESPASPARTHRGSIHGGRGQGTLPNLEFDRTTFH